MEFSVLIALLAVFWTLQYVMSYRQTKDYNETMQEISRKPSGYVGVGIARTKFNLGPGTVLILATDLDGYITEYRELHGTSVFSRFQERKNFIGENIHRMNVDTFKKTQKKAYTQATSLINEEMSKNSKTPIIERRNQ